MGIWASIGIILITISFSALTYYLYQTGKSALSLSVIIILGLVLRLYTASDPMLHDWDERYHALVAKNMMEQPFHPKLYKEHVLDYSYKDWITGGEVWLHKQPMPMWTMALSMKLFGVYELTARLPAVLLSTLCILLTFLIGKYLYNEPVGLIAALLFALNGLVVEITSGRVATEHIDVFFMFFIELSVLLIVLNHKKKRLYYLGLAGIACGLAILSKWLPALIVFPLFLILNYQDRKPIQLLKGLVMMGLTTLLIALPWQLYAYFNYPEEYLWEQLHNYRHITEGLDGHGKPWWFFINNIRITVNELIYLALIWWGYQAYRQSISNKALFLLTWIGIPFIFFSLVSTKMQGYLLFTFPAYFIIIALFVQHLWQILPRLPTFKKVLCQILVLGVFILAIRYSIERIKPFDMRENAFTAKEELLAVELPEQAIVFNAPCPLKMMFHHDYIAYRNMTDSLKITRLIAEDRPVYVVDNERVPEGIKKIEQVKWLKLPAQWEYCD